MTNIDRAFTNVLVADVHTSAQFYETLLGMRRHFDSEWFVLLAHPDFPGFEFGVLDRNHETVPKSHNQTPQGLILTFVVGSVDEAYATALEMKATVVEPPRDMPYGQKRLLLQDPDGALIDLSAPIS